MSGVYATYSLKVDLNRDGDYSDAGEDISAYLSLTQAVDGQCGMAQPYDRIARTNTLRLFLVNSTNKFSPGHASALAGFTKQCPILLQMTYSAVTVTLYKGHITSINPSIGLRGDRLSEITCDGFLVDLMDAKLNMPVQENVTTGVVIDTILQAARVFPVGFVGWLAGLDTYSNAGTTTYAPPATSNYAILDSGAHTFELVGDNWSEDVTAYEALRNVVDAEWGKLFERPDGKIEFWGRQHLFEDLPSALDGTLTDTDVRSSSYHHGKWIINSARITCHQRTVDDDISVLAEIDKAVYIKKGKTAEVTMNLRDAANNQLSGKDYVQPVIGVDYKARVRHTSGLNNSAGIDITNDIGVTINPSGSSIKWLVVNADRHNISLYFGQQRGRKITDFGNITVSGEDADSIKQNRLQEFQLDIPALEDAEEANDLADFLVTTRKDAIGSDDSITLIANKSSALMVHARDRKIGDRIRRTDAQTGMDREFFVTGRRDSIGQRLHTVTLTLEPRPPFNGWLAGTSGFSEAGTTTLAVF